MSNTKNVNVKRPGEKEEGKFHYNPGNMSGKKAGVKKEQSGNGDQFQSGEEMKKQD